MSTRHLGFVELGRSRPSPELLAVIADRLDVPPRELKGVDLHLFSVMATLGTPLGCFDLLRRVRPSFSV